MTEKQNATDGAVDPDWVRAVRKINRLGVGPELLAASPWCPTDVHATDDLSDRCQVYSFDDVVWEITEWMLDRYAEDGLTELIDANEAELNDAYGDDDYQLDSCDLFSTFMLFYMKTRDGSNASDAVPSLFLQFEVWLSGLDRTLFDRLHLIRDIGLSCGQEDLQAQNDNIALSIR